MNTSDLALVLTDIVLGVPKEESRFRDLPDFDEVWDDLFTGHQDDLAAGYVSEIPYDID